MSKCHQQDQPSVRPSAEWLANAALRKEYREERESELTADLEAYRLSEESATSFAQMIIKSGFLLNGGGVIAIPAIVALFNIDANRITDSLLFTGGCFVFGLCSAAIAGILGFFALAHKADFALLNATRTARNLEGNYFPSRSQEMYQQANDATKRRDRLRRYFIIERSTGIIFCFVSLIAFVGGAYVGGSTISTAPHVYVKTSIPYIPPCKDGSQSCQPWLRDWNGLALAPGTTINNSGNSLPPSAQAH